jgi:hypothetical protein
MAAHAETRRMRSALVLLLLAVVPASASAQAEGGTARLRARADAAFARHDSASARAAYEALLRLDPAHSRAVYQLGRLQPPGSAAALRLFRRYTELEPADAWGFLALGVAYEDAGERAAARAAYAAALALEPGSPEMRAAAARVASKPARTVALEPVARFSTDSDGNRMTRAGLSGGVAVADSVTVGAALSRLEVSDGFTRVRGLEGTLAAEWRPLRALLLQGRAGALGMGGASAVPLEAVGQLRVRWRPERGPAIDVRARREPLTATPQLVAAPVVLSEARATIEVPVVSVLRARGMTRHGRLSAPGEANERTSWSAGPVLRLGTAELAGSWARTTYARPSTAGYFAPRSVEALDAGVYFEHYGWWPVTLVLDAGGGVERVTPHTDRVLPQRPTAAAGEWQRALRLWSQLSWAVTEHGELRLEVEAYETQVGDVVAAGAGGWRWGSVGLSLMWRPRTG